MSIVVVGVNHRNVPIDVLERMMVPVAGLPKALAHLNSSDHIAEVTVLSTCNRTEVYAVCETFHGAIGAINAFFADLSGLPPSRFAEHLFTAYDDAVAGHLFRVASGLDSAIVGESEILGQVKSAWESARTNGVCGPHLSGLFRHALEVGKRVRTETGIARGTASVSHAAVELAAAQLGTLAGKSVLVLGTGEIGVSMVGALRHAGASEVLVANRTRAKAANLAKQIGGSYVPLHELPQALERVDVLLTATSSDSVVLEHGDVVEVMAARQGRALVVVDAALPRDVDSSVALIEGVTLLDLDSIRRFAEAGLEHRRREIDHVEEIVGDEVDRYEASAAARQLAPVITSLRSKVEDMRADEMSKLEARLAALGPADRELVETLSRKLLAKVLHGPTVRLKENAGTVRGQRMADALRVLFDLDEE